jgi:tRNA nucleotidyltransferase (CCA-adding enzyme)
MMCKISDEVVAAILKKGKIYEVGGAVRDRMLNREVELKDRDYLVCGITLDELSRILNKFGDIDLVGRSFGVIKFTQRLKSKRFTFDVALPRREISTGPGHRDFTVDFDPHLTVEDDLLRRDFTINAMAIALDKEELVDPFGGLKDLRNGLIRMVSLKSFPEDPLRMLRAIQFAARFEFKIEPATYAAIKEHSELIKTISPERTSEEINKLLLKAGKPSLGFYMMLETGLLKYIFPELVSMVGVEQPGGYHKYDVFEHTLRTVDSSPRILRVRLAALFHDVAKPQTKQVVDDKATFYGHEKIGARAAENTLKRLRYPNELIHDVALLVDKHMFTTDVTDKGRRRLIRKVGAELIFDLLALRRADVVAQGMGGTTEDVDRFEKEIQEEIERKPPFSIRELALNGDDVMSIFNLPQSPLIGEILNHLLDKVLDDPGCNDRDRLVELTRLYLNNRENKNNQIYLMSGDSE